VQSTSTRSTASGSFSGPPGSASRRSSWRSLAPTTSVSAAAPFASSSKKLKESGCTEKRASVNEQTALLSAVQDVGLDVEAAVEMLESEELEEDVWDSYRHLQQSGLEAIPLWVFTVRHEIPKPDGEPGELFPVVKPYVVSGSSTSATFEKVFETIADDAEAAAELREAQQTPKL